MTNFEILFEQEFYDLTLLLYKYFIRGGGGAGKYLMNGYGVTLKGKTKGKGLKLWLMIIHTFFPYRILKCQDYQELGKLFSLILFWIKYEEEFYIYHYIYSKKKITQKIHGVPLLQEGAFL